jgi:DinB superfamily
MTVTIARPEADEYLPFYHTYVSRVPDGDLIGLLAAQIRETAALMRAPSFATRGSHRYAPDKWTVTQVVGHMADAERVFAYRAMRFARGDETPLAGFDENAFVRHGGFEGRALDEVVREFEAVRGASIALFGSFDAAAARRRGAANGASVSVRALGYIVAGHELHHRSLLQSRYA